MGALLEDSPVRATSANMAELVVEWLPTLGRNAADGEWCDITPYVTAISTKRGRTYALDQFESGDLTITLEQTKTATIPRLFDPEFTTGPFYPYLIPMKQVKVSAVYGGTFYPVLRGYITDWGQAVEDDAKFTVTIQARDAFAVLERISLPSSAWALEVQKDDPSLWFRLGETGTARVTDSSDGGNYGIYDNVEQGVEGLVVNDADAAVQVDASTDARVVIQNPSLITDYPFTISAMFQLGNNNAQRMIFAGVVDITDANPALLISVPNAVFGTGYEGKVLSQVINGANQRAVLSSIVVQNDRPHHLMIAYVSNASHLMYVDGVDVTLASGSNTSWIGNPPNGYTIGNTTDGYFGSYEFQGIIDEVCVWDGIALSSDRAAAHSLAALDGWAGDDSGARADRFLDAIDWPATLRDIETGASTLGPASWSAGSSALSALQGWADTELGAFFAGKDGKLVWRSRHYPYLEATSTTSQATFGDKHSGEALKYVDATFVRDENLIRNPVTASRTNGVSVTVKDQALIDAKYGDLTYAAPNSEDQLDSAIRDRALWILARYKELGTRLEAMVLDPTILPTLWPYVLGLEIGDRITVERTTMGTGNQLVSEQIIEHIEHVFTPFSAQTIIIGSPVDPNVGDYLILDDAVFGLLDTGLLAY